MRVELRAPQVRMIEEMMGPQYCMAFLDCTLPAIAWRNILDVMKQDAFGPYGGKRRDVPRAFYTTMSTIQEAVTRMEKHPALTSTAVMGVETEIIPAWEVAPGRWSPYPWVDAEFRLLTPRHTEVSGHLITDWIPESGIEGSFLWCPSTHWDFVMTD